MTLIKTYTCTSTSTCTHTCLPSEEKPVCCGFHDGGMATESGLGQWQSPMFRLSDHLPPAVRPAWRPPVQAIREVTA